MKHGIIGESKGCPLLFHVNGEMKDISKIDSKNGYLYGGINSDTSVQMTGGGHQVIIRHKISNNSWAEAKLRLAGKGPGELWSCHWNLDVCLPESDNMVARRWGTIRVVVCVLSGGVPFCLVVSPLCVDML